MQKKTQFWLVLSLVSLMLAQVPHLLACASCGSGAGDAIFLGPNEKFKLYTAARVQNFVYRLGSEGDKAAVYDVSQQRYVDVGLAYRILPRAYVSVYSGAQWNHSDDRSDSGVQQPLFAGRVTLLRTDIAKSWRPQLQVLMSYRPKMFTDRYEGLDRQGLDVFGSGHHEVSIGYDAFNNLKKVFWGVSQSLKVSTETDVGDDIKTRPGIQTSHIASVGAAYYRQNKVMAGYILSLREERVSSGDSIDGTKMRSHGAYIGADYKLKKNTQIRATYTASGLGNSKNTGRAGGLTLGLFHTWF